MNGAIPPILVAADDTESSDEAIRQADARGRATSTPVVVCTVVPTALQINPLAPTAVLPFDLSDLSTRVEERLRARVAQLTLRAPNDVDVRVLEGSPHVSILELAEQIGARLIVVGSHGRSGIVRFVLGSVAERVVRYATCPVLIARPRTLGGRVVAATDFSDAALPVLRAGLAEAAAAQGQLTVVHCIDVSELDWIGATLGARPGPLAFSTAALGDMRRDAQKRIADALASCGGAGDALVLEGRPAPAIIDAAKNLHAELIVVGTEGKAGLRRFALGSVAEAVIRGAETSVLVVRLGGDPPSPP